MKARALLLAASIAVFACLGCSKKIDANFEGTLTMRTTLTGAAPKDLVLEIKAGKMRFDTEGEGGSPMHGVYDPIKNEVLVFMDAEKSYMTLDFAKASAPAPNTTPEASVAEKVGRKDTVAGISCEQWVAREPSGKRSEVCVIEGVNFFDLSRLRSGASGLAGLGKASMQDKKMFPLRSVELDASGKEISRMEVTAVEKRSIDDARFATPAGYTKLEVPTASP